MACSAQTCRKKRQVIKLETEKDVSVALAQYIADLSEKHIKTKCSFSVVLSGGKLIHTLRKLVESYKESVDWSKWHVFWVDERKCSFESESSNYKLAKDGFLSKVPIPEQNIFPMYFHKYPERMAENYEVRLKTLVDKKTISLSASGDPIFDLMLLGIGPDGHIASLFPDQPERHEKRRWVTCVYSPSQPPSLLRTTLTFPVIKSALNIAMVVTGKGVADAVYKTLGSGGQCPPIPCAELHAEAEGGVTWFLDKDAASKLN
ncbi:probable 6-phosphogluconolactonase 4 chloroplastic [Phtheirospermum japonicum]|uniref:Probable 6-phosphogluconolactonase n=1 Tax=Phtheirospermum japonicum TaxID=374723 RepID=A0A830C3C9_9LAMI|nr:probable 6-phosphogluconolactonase 4 chloroplastic [Phtheirospermum japonicum]